MIGYTEIKVFPPDFVAAYRDAVRMVEGLPSFDHPPDGWNVRCHELARAVRVVLGQRQHDIRMVAVVDGKFGQPGGVRAQHSWLELFRAPHAAILDVYAVGRLPQVQLVSAEHLHKFQGQYHECKLKDLKIDEGLVAKLALHARAVFLG